MSPEIRKSLANHVAADKEETELETLVSVLGTPSAQNAAKSHTLPEMIAAEQGHGTDYLNQSFNRRAA